MPNIYELPAMGVPAGATANMTPGQMRAQGQINAGYDPRWTRGQTRAHSINMQGQQGQPQASADPMQMLEGQRVAAFANIDRQFNIAAADLSKQGLEPDAYKKAYSGLQFNVMSAYAKEQGIHEAYAADARNLDALVEAGELTGEEAHAQKLVMAGVPVALAYAPLRQKNQTKPSTQLNDIVSMRTKIMNFRDRFKDKRGQPIRDLYRSEANEGLQFQPAEGGPMRKASAAEIAAFDASIDQLRVLDMARQKVFNMLSPMEQLSQAGANAVSKFGLDAPETESALPVGGRINMPFGAFGGGIDTGFGAKPSVSTNPSASELRKQGTKEAYDRGVKLGYWE